MPMAKQIPSVLSLLSLPTKAALLQSKFHRIIKEKAAKTLRPYHMSVADWVILGFLGHKNTPTNIGAIASDMGVKTPFMTVRISSLLNRGLVSVIGNSEDNRQKRVELTKRGRAALTLADNAVRQSFFPLLNGVSIAELAAYFSAIKKMIKNFERK